MGWLILASIVLIAFGAARSPFEVRDGWLWTQLVIVAVLASGLAAIAGHRRCPAGRGRGVAVGQSGAVLCRIVVMTYGFMPRLSDRRRLVALERSGVHAMAQACRDPARMTDALTARNCRLDRRAGAADARGRVNFLELGKSLHFQPKRLFWLHRIAAGQWAGRTRSPRVGAGAGGGERACRAHLDDGATKETVTLDSPARALYIGTWVWQ